MFSVSMNLERSIMIQKPVEEVYKKASDFNIWNVWSPWLCIEPNCQYKATGSAGTLGHKQEWDGKFIGSGQMHIIQALPNKQVDFELMFLKPWKSQAKTSFLFEAHGNQTKMTWTMQSSLPIFMFFFKKLMTALIGSDYQRGLSMFKEYLETSRVPSKIENKGVVEQKSFSCIGFRETCSLEDMAPSMAKNFSKLHEMGSVNKLHPKPDFSLSIYHNYDFVKKTCDYTAAIAYTDDAKLNGYELNTPGLIRSSYSVHKALKVDFWGAYRFLGNAWSAIMSYQRGLKLSHKKSLPMYEIYKSMPNEVGEDKAHTELYLPIK